MGTDYDIRMRIRAPRGVVFERLLRIEHLARWFCGWARIEPRVGGGVQIGGGGGAGPPTGSGGGGAAGSARTRLPWRSPRSASRRSSRPPRTACSRPSPPQTPWTTGPRAGPPEVAPSSSHGRVGRSPWGGAGGPTGFGRSRRTGDSSRRGGPAPEGGGGPFAPRGGG